MNQLSSLESLILDNNMELHLLPATLLKMENLKIIGLSWYASLYISLIVRSLSVLVSMHLIERPRKWLKKGRGQWLVVCFRELLAKRKFTTV